jgi:sugar lactone lactonase YvrE
MTSASTASSADGQTLTPRVLLSGLNFPEAPRWHRDRLWFSDVRARRIMTVDECGSAEVIVELDEETSGLGFMPDGSLLMVSVNHQRILRFREGKLTQHANLVGAPGLGPSDFLNDMVVDEYGGAYIGSRTPNLGVLPPGPTDLLIYVSPFGEVTTVAHQLEGTNGMVLTPDELVVAETNGRRLTAFDRRPDGSLESPRDFADMRGAFPDGICADAEGAIWLASVFSGPFMRVTRGGSVTHTIIPAVGEAVACELGGVDGHMLFLVCCDAAGLRRAWSEQKQSFVALDVPEPTDAGTIQVVRVRVGRQQRMQDGFTATAL